MLEDIALARAVKRVRRPDRARRRLARWPPAGCTRSWRELVDGYSKSLWASFGSPAGAAAVVVLLLLLYAVPPVLAVVPLAPARAGWPCGAVAYLLGVAGRVVSARATGGRAWPDALAHPVSSCVFGWLVRALVPAAPRPAG